MDDLLLQISSSVVWQSRDIQLSRNTLYPVSLFFFIVLKRDLFVYRDDSLTSMRVIMLSEQPIQCCVPLQKLRARLPTRNSLLTVPSRLLCCGFLLPFLVSEFR